MRTSESSASGASLACHQICALWNQTNSVRYCPLCTWDVCWWPQISISSPDLGPGAASDLSPLDWSFISIVLELWHWHACVILKWRCQVAFLGFCAPLLFPWHLKLSMSIPELLITNTTLPSADLLPSLPYPNKWHNCAPARDLEMFLILLYPYWSMHSVVCSLFFSVPPVSTLVGTGMG